MKPDNTPRLRHHAYAIEARAEEGIAVAQAWALRELGIKAVGNPDFVTLRYGLLSVEDARSVADIALQAPLAGEHKVVIIAAARAYREAQNALLKLFEEPPRGTYLFLILPSLGGLLPTLRSRVQVLSGREIIHTIVYTTVHTTATDFLQASRERRSAIIKKLATGKDEEERRAHRDEAIAIVNGVEATAYAKAQDVGFTKPYMELLGELQTLRGYLHERAAPVRMILEHLAIVIPRGLGEEQ